MIGSASLVICGVWRMPVFGEGSSGVAQALASVNAAAPVLPMTGFTKRASRHHTKVGIIRMCLAVVPVGSR
jgi:hypothetical protein